MKQIKIDKIKERAKQWETKIKTRAESMPQSASLLHYDQGYRLYSSLEHSDTMAIDAYIQERDKPSRLINSGPSDTYIDIALTHNFVAMADLFIAVMNYFDIQRPDIAEKLITIWRALDRDSTEGQ
ncbi:hypothetical protein [Nitrosococcus oceani]|uniref:hypothetical protein n=1 Tax=Nitrosococcus oceani TaxID=1229 RepID=UPI0004E90170|nr:hypothetical protein [Nitrosococcus oceani]KFI23945.1 hypothetical protein HW44_00835 [Nitrosococcus oceani]